MSEDIVVVGGVRTPFGRFGGALSQVPAIDLGAHALQHAVRGAGLDPDVVDAVYLGHCLPTPTMTPARMAALRAGMGLRTTSLTIDRACCSAMAAIAQAAVTIGSGTADVVAAGGMESMSRAPYLLPRRTGRARPGDLTVHDPLVIRNPFLDEPMARYTGTTSLEFGVDRHQQDEWALLSHQRWQAAHAAGRFADEVVAAPEWGLDHDEPPRPDTSLAALARLNTVYGSPTVTPGNAPGLNDGAAAVIVTSAHWARTAGIEPLARIRSHAAIAGDPRLAVQLPATALRAAMDRSRVRLQDLDLIEINEAFAATPLVTTLSLADGDGAGADRLRERTNVNGGAVAIGHPIGASGARLVLTAVQELRRRGGGLAGAAICGGVGHADAMILEV